MARQTRRFLLAPLEERALALLLRQPERAWYRSALARELAVAASSLQRPLTRLVATGILRAYRDGNRVYYQADTAHPVYPELCGLVAKTSGFAMS